jgi:hypothetical protein
VLNYPLYEKKNILPYTITGLAPNVELNLLKTEKQKEENKDLFVYPAGIPFLLEKNKKKK